MVELVKKKFLECEIHGLTLFRCKRKCWNSGDKFYSDYNEECFKCISNDGYKKEEKIIEKKKHFKI